MRQQRTSGAAREDSGVSQNALITALVHDIGGVRLEDNDQYTFRMQIKSWSSSRLYTVALRKRDGVWCCSCMGWIRNHKGGVYYCQHLTAMRPALERITQARPSQVR